jgi:predicted nucleic acid-binding protein
MLVVSDTSPLSNLALIGRLELLRVQFTKVVIPTAVSRELSALQVPVARLALADAVTDGWLMEMALPGDAPFPAELHGLDPGETEAIRLANWISADGVLMDEREGRSRAEMLGIRTIGVLGVLLAGKRDGLVASIKVEIDRLRQEAGFFVSPTLEIEILKIAGE